MINHAISIQSQVPSVKQAEVVLRNLGLKIMMAMMGTVI